MRVTPWPKPVGKAPEVRLINGVQHLDNGALQYLVLQRGNAQRPQPPIRLRVGWAASEVPFALVLFRRPPAKPDMILS
jgi:hypothetical protein